MGEYGGNLIMTRNIRIDIEEAICELEQTTSMLGFMEIAFSYTKDSIDKKEVADVMCMLYKKQRDALEEIKKIVVLDYKIT